MNTALRSRSLLHALPLFTQWSSLSSLVWPRPAILLSRESTVSGWPSLSLAIPAAINLHIPNLLPDIWGSILRAVPKKKTSHSKSRHRQMAGKALEDVTALSKCSACGKVKRAHLLCPYCVKSIKDMWLGKEKKVAEDKVDS